MEYLVNSNLRHNGQEFVANDIVEADVLGEVAIKQLVADGVIEEYHEETDQPAPKRRVGRPAKAEAEAGTEAPAEAGEGEANVDLPDEIDV